MKSVPFPNKNDFNLTILPEKTIVVNSENCRQKAILWRFAFPLTTKRKSRCANAQQLLPTLNHQAY